MRFEKYTTVETRVVVRLASARECDWSKGALSILQKVPKIWKWWRMEQTFLEKIFRKSNNRWISDRTFWKIREQSWKERKLSERNFRNLVYHTRLSSFWNFLKMPFHSLPEGLVEWKAPKSFLGLASYYQRFFPNYAQVAWPLHKLTEAHVDFASTSECQLSFDTLKILMSTAQILQQSLCSTQTTPIMVWNCRKLGEGWGWSPVAYASQTLT